jgi:hypothetical protein
MGHERSVIMGYDLLQYVADHYKGTMKRTERPAPATKSDLAETLEALHMPVPAKLKPHHWTDQYRK